VRSPQMLRERRMWRSIEPINLPAPKWWSPVLMINWIPCYLLFCVVAGQGFLTYVNPPVVCPTAGTQPPWFFCPMFAKPIPMPLVAPS